MTRRTPSRELGARSRQSERRSLRHSSNQSYNGGYAGERLRVIDMPQAVDARTNPNACSLLARDVANVCRYFASQGADAEPGTFALELWDLYRRAEL